MRRHPEIETDLWALYRVEARDRLELGRMDLVLRLIDRLSYEPGSHWRAKAVGGEDWEPWVAWDRPTALLASLIDMTGHQTQATAVNPKAKFRELVDRPKQKKQSRVVSTRGNVAAAMAALRGR